MHTLTTYQAAAVRNAEDLDSDRLSLNLMIALGEMAKSTIAAEDATTKPLQHFQDNPYKSGFNREQAQAAIGAILFNAAVLADRFGIDLGELAEMQLAKVERITNSGRLRMLAGQGK